MGETLEYKYKAFELPTFYKLRCNDFNTLGLPNKLEINKGSGWEPTININRFSAWNRSECKKCHWSRLSLVEEHCKICGIIKLYKHPEINCRHQTV